MARNLNIFNKRNDKRRGIDNKPADVNVNTANIVRDQME